MAQAGPEDVLVTGANGFLGAYLCAELLRQTAARIHCLVRGKSDEDATRRLKTRLMALRLGPAELSRISVVSGDLSQPELGLSPARCAALAGAVQAVYHCGASVDLSAGYAQLSPSNVDGTRHVLQFAEQGPAKVLHYISTLGLFVGARAGGLSVVDERSLAPPATVPDIGYLQTKLVSEREVREAGRRGVPVVIYRPGMVLGDSRTGACPCDDLIARLLAAAVAVGQAPGASIDVPVGCVDTTARAIVALSRRPAVLGRTFHTIQPRSLTVSALFNEAREFGYDFAEVSMDAWRSTLEAHSDEPAAFAMLALWRLAVHVLDTEGRDRSPDTRCDATNELLAEMDICWPETDASFFALTFEHLIESDALPAPTRYLDSLRSIFGPASRRSSIP